MFKKILLPLDGSATAEQALFWAKQYAGPDKAQVVLLQFMLAGLSRPEHRDPPDLAHQGGGDPP